MFREAKDRANRVGAKLKPRPPVITLVLDLSCFPPTPVAASPGYLAAGLTY